MQEKTDEKGKMSDEKILLDECRGLGYNTRCQCDGLSPNGKATDSDSVIVKVRILLPKFSADSENSGFFYFHGQRAKRTCRHGQLAAAARLKVPCPHRGTVTYISSSGACWAIYASREPRSIKEGTTPSLVMQNPAAKVAIRTACRRLRPFWR